MGKVLEWLSGRSHLNKDGSETLDPRPIEIPIGFEKPPTIQELIRRFVTDPALRAELQGKDVESFDDADDFEMDDDMPQSPHEDVFDPLHLLAREQEIMSGTVAQRSPEELRAAADLIEKHRKVPPAPPAAPKA